jgi:hypothetical protein
MVGMVLSMLVVLRIPFNLPVLTEQEEIPTRYTKSLCLLQEQLVGLGVFPMAIADTTPMVIELTERIIRWPRVMPLAVLP